MSEDDRKDDQGRDSRREPNWVKREHFLFSAIAAIVLGGGGGAVGVNRISDRLDAQKEAQAAFAKEQNEKLDRLVLSLTELRGVVTATEKGAVKVDAELLALVGRVSALEKAEAAHNVKLEEHERRIAATEGKK